MSSGESIPFVTSTSALAGESVADDATDDVADNGRGHHMPPRTLWLCGVGLLTVCAALRAMAVTASGHHPASAESTTALERSTGPSMSYAAAPPPLFDEGGCPVHATCLLDLFPDPDIARAVQAHFPGATASTITVTLDARSKKQYRIAIEARTRDGVLVTLIAQSYPTGSVQASEAWWFTYPDTATARVPANAGSGVYVVGGKRYTVTIGLIATPGHGLPTTVAAALAHDPLCRLSKPPRHPPCQVECV
jgi:hypothetical protein